MREAELRLEDQAACEQNRVRAEINAADRTAAQVLRLQQGQWQ